MQFSFSYNLKNGEKAFIMEYKACLWNRTHPEWPLCVNVVYLPLAILRESPQLQHPIFWCGFNYWPNRRWHCYSLCRVFFRQGHQLLALHKVSINWASIKKFMLLMNIFKVWKAQKLAFDWYLLCCDIISIHIPWLYWVQQCWLNIKNVLFHHVCCGLPIWLGRNTNFPPCYDTRTNT